MSHAAPVSGPSLLPAGLERRFTAYAIDRAIAWLIAGGVGYVAWRLADGPRWWLVGAVVVGVLVVLGLLGSALLGVAGTSPGKAMVGLRVLRATDGRPIGMGPALVRTTALGLAGLPTLGLGVATLGWTAAADPSGGRRAWHDRFGDASVVDVRPVPAAPAEDLAAPPEPVVNLTAARLRPDAAGQASLPEAPVAGSQSEPAPVAQPGPVAPVAPALPPAAPEIVSSRPTPTSGALVPTGPAGTQLRDASAGSRWRVTFDTGETFVVEGLALVGRRPEPRSGEPVRHVVPLRSEDMSLSKTHAQFQVVPDGALVVMDRGSTNGSQVLRRGVAKPLSPGRPSTLVDGDIVRFGDRTMRVVREA